MLRVLLMLAAVLLPFGGLYITSLPTGADVWVDGSYIGRTPLVIDGLRAGKHAVTITKSGWKVEEVDQDVTAGVVTPATVQLEAMGSSSEDGTLTLIGPSDAATVALDDGPAQSMRQELAVRPGVHRLIVRDGQTKFERSIAIYPNQTTYVLLRSPAEGKSGVVAPLTEYMPAAAAKISGQKLVVRWAGHLAVGRIGDARFLVDGRDVVYDAPAGLVRGRLYLPLDLILTLAGGKSK